MQEKLNVASKAEILGAEILRNNRMREISENMT